MGDVHSATSVFGPDPVAIKILREDLAGDDETVARFLREKRIFNTIDHPNVVKMLDLVVERDRIGLVMELIEGGDLKALISSGKTSRAEVIDLVHQIASGLAHIHSVGVVHCDLKPANVLVSDRDGRRTAKISDFGVSRLLDETGADTSSPAGTPLYMAPEATSPHDAGAPSDVYALGAMLFEMLIGKPPFFGGGKMAVVVAHSRYPAPVIAGAPSELSDLVGEMLSKDPADRPTAAEVANRLKALSPLVDETMVPSAASPIGAEAFPKRRERTVPSKAVAEPESATLPWGVGYSSLRRATELPITRVTEVPVRRLDVLVAASVLVALVGLVAWIAREPSESLAAAGSLDGDSTAQSVIAERSATTSPAGPTVLQSPGGAENSTDSTARFSRETAPASSSSTSSTSEQPAGSESAVTTPIVSTSTSRPATTSSAAPTSSVAPATVGTVPVTTAAVHVVHTHVVHTEPVASSTAPTTRVTINSTTLLPTTFALTLPPSTKPSTTLAPTTVTASTTTQTTTPPPTTTPTTTPTTESPTTTAQTAAQQIAIVSGPQIISVGPTSALFSYRTNDVCGSGSFVYRKQSTGEYVGQWDGDDGCFGPTHFGTTAWPGITLEPDTTYEVSISVVGKPSDGVLAAGVGRTNSSIVITTPPQAAASVEAQG